MKTKRIFKSAASIVLAVLMVFSTVLVGTVSIQAAAIPEGTVIYVDASSVSDQWTNVYMSVVAPANSSYTANASNTTGAGSYVPKSDKWVQMTRGENGIYSATVPEASSVGKLSFWSEDESYYDNVWQVNCSLGNTYDGVNNLFTIGSASTYHNDRQSYCFSGTWSSMTPAALECPEGVLNGTEVMFYIKSWENGDGAIGLSNGASGDANCIRATEVDHAQGYGYMQIAKNQLSNYIYITNNIPSWSGIANSDIRNAEGGELFQADGTVTTTPAVSASTELSAQTVSVGSTDPLVLTNTASALQSVYNKDLYVMYYLDGTLLNEELTPVTTSASSFDADVSGLSAGTHTLQTVLTDKNIFYIADTDEFEVIDVVSHNVIFTASTGGTVKVNGQTASPVAVNENESYTVSVVPDPDYFVDTFTVDGADMKSALQDNVYTGQMGTEDVEISVVFAAVEKNVTASASPAEGGSVTVNGAASCAAEIGDKITLAYTANPGWRFVKYTDAQGQELALNDDDTYTVTEENTVIVGVFEKISYNVTDNSSNGKVLAYVNGSDEASDTYTVGDSVKFVLVPDEGYKLSTFTYNSADVTSEVVSGAYTVDSAPAGGITVAATFVPNSQPAHTFYLADLASGSGSSASAGEILAMKSSTFSLVSTDAGGIETYVSNDVVTGSRTYTVHDGTQILHSRDNSTQDQYWLKPQEESASSAAPDDRTVWKTTATGAYYYNESTSNVNIYITYDPENDNITSLYERKEPEIPKYTVTMNQGISSEVNGQIGNSGFDGVTSASAVTRSFTYDDMVVEFTTQINDTYVSEGETHHIYKVLGYQIEMTLQDGSIALASVNGNAISHIKGGLYQASYQFPENVQSAVVTPIFTVSDAYAVSRGITFTRLYIRYAPGDTRFFNGSNSVYYYTWRGNEDDAEKTEVSVETSTGTWNLEREPEGVWAGQKMLYVGNNMFMIDVQSDISGIVFSCDDNTNQTFDFNEFIKLQKLGYDNITFEPMESNTENIAAALNTAYNAGGNKTYFDGAAVTAPITLNDSVIDSEFVLDKDFEGNYIDVFGNPLVDPSTGEPINSRTIRATNSSDELQEILRILGLTDASVNSLFGARWGDISQVNNYDMNYANRVYYFNNNKTMVSQQISGYGPIEGALSEDGKTANAEAYAPMDWNYYYGDNNNTAGEFVTGYELIPEDYVGVPYLVSYKNPVTHAGAGTRIDGKWYYQRSIPQVVVNVAVGLMNSDGTIVKNADGTVKEYGDEIGTASVNGEASVTVDQGSSVTISATPATKYKFKGFYDQKGMYITDQNLFSLVVGSSRTFYAVFQELEEGTLTITNSIYRGSNPENGGGNGTVRVSLTITHADGSSDTYRGTGSVTAPITDGDKYQWKITGTPLGVDKFLTFRHAEPTSEGELYYAALDDESCLSNDGATWTYTSYAGAVWNWYGQVGSGEHYQTFNFYTDFQKVSVMATLNYKYIDRFGATKTYTVKNVELSYDEIANDYIPSNDTILAHAPVIDEIFKDCTWDVTDVTKLSATSSSATLVATQKEKTYKIYIDKQGVGTAELYDDAAAYNTLLEVTVPRVSGDKQFSYWMAYNVDEFGGKLGEGQIVCTDVYYAYRITKDIYLEAVYGKELEDPFFTNITDAVYTREKYTDENGNVQDYIYTDFLVQFEYAYLGLSLKDVVENGADGVHDVKLGLITEVDTAYTAEGGYTGTGDMATPETKKEYIMDTVQELYNTGAAQGWNASAVKGEAQYNYYYSLYELNSQVDNFTSLGRYDYCFKISNTAANRAVVFNVYTYIMYTDDDGVQHVVLSAPKTMNIYELGIKTDGEF